MVRANADGDWQAIFFGLRQQIDFVFATDMQEMRRLPISAYYFQDSMDGIFLGMNRDKLVG